MQGANNIHYSINLKPTYVLNFLAAESRAIAGHDINTRTQSTESARCFNSQSRDIVGRSDHQQLFYPLVGMWRKIHFQGWHHSDKFFLYSGSERVKRYRAFPIDTCVVYTFIGIICLSKHCVELITKSRFFI
ncbi:hypothetical protein TNCV_2485951 [Trichonephila clavipes]|uniref:Uncharacterized protein n=1 Tax=Trichonephila clavipes TaxID=2585209 RepID=A0A8X6VZM6_TRICX|nr:hypothetical protein TNCV_2485951 [Trichonephila clavipes]